MGISYKVLIIDDEEMMRNLLVSLFSEHGHRCETAPDGIEALEKIKKNSFDAVVADIAMPHMDGITFTKELAKSNLSLPIMIMTGYAHEHTAKLAIEAGAQEFIRKPFSIDEFIIRFDKMMCHHMEEKELLALSLTDELTGLYNRRRFFVLTEQYLKVANRTKKRSLLLYIDVDDLKWINDHFGHHEGDQALIDFAMILKKTFRESDIIARIGGDEFVVLLESSNGNDEILITHLYENIKDHNATGFHRYKLSISVGVAEFDPEYPVSIDELLSKADALMYAQKRRRWKEHTAGGGSLDTRTSTRFQTTGGKRHLAEAGSEILSSAGGGGKQMGNNLLETENEKSSFISFLNELTKPPEFGPVGSGLVMTENKSDASVPLKNDEMDPSKSSKVKNAFLETESKNNPFISFLNGAEGKCQTDPTDPRQKIPRNEQNTPFLSSFLVELIHVLKNTVPSIKNFSLLAMDKPDDLELQKHSHRILTEDIGKIDSVLNSLLNCIDINKPIIKSNTLYIILQEVLEANEGQLQNKKIKVFKKCEKDLPETFLHDEQIRFILNSVLQYAILSTPFNGTIGFLTKSIDFQNGDPDKKISPERNGGYIELGIGFIGDKHPDEPSKDLPGISANQKEERLNLILEMVRETLQKNHGSMAYEVDPKKTRALITLRFPIERRKVVYYEPIAL